MENAEILTQDGKVLFSREIDEVVQEIFTPRDLQVHPFSIGCYNDLVGPKFAFDLPRDTVALVVISGPSVFEKSVIPFLQSQLCNSQEFSTMDPLDESMKYIFGLFLHDLQKKGYEVEAIHDFDLYPNRRPKVLVQTAAHVAGAAEYFLKNRLTTLELLPPKKLFGVAIHPKYGGWFAIRGIILLKNVQKEIKQIQPLNLLRDESEIEFLLEQFTYNWKANLWRDVIPTKKKYSTDFLEYLETDPDKRWEFIQSKNYFNCIKSTG